MFVIISIQDSVAQLVARLTPDQKAPCSSHVRVNVFFYSHTLNTLLKLGIKFIAHILEK